MSVSYKIEAYIDNLPDAEKEIAKNIRTVILEYVPDAEEKFSFGIPFYHYYGMFCYINFLKKGGGIELVFCRGRDLQFAFPELDSKGRTMVAGFTVSAGAKGYEPTIKALLLTAAEVQKEAMLLKKPFVKAAKKKGAKN